MPHGWCYSASTLDSLLQSCQCMSVATALPPCMPTDPSCDRANAVQAQQHAFNTPLQLGPRMEDGSQFDQPEDADKYKLQLEAGDVLILATDGILDNM